MSSAPLPLAWESPKSILCRFASQNYFSTVANALGERVEDLSYAIDLLTGNHPSVKNIVNHIRAAFLTQVVDYSGLFYKQLPGVTEDSALEVGGIEIPYSEVEVVKHRICNQCHSEYGHSKVFADLRVFTTCPVHHRQYFQACPVCKKSWKWSKFRLDKCHYCASDLNHAASVSKQVIEEDGLYQIMLTGHAQQASDVFYLFNHLRRFFEDDLVQSGQVLGVALDFLFGRFELLIKRLMTIYLDGDKLPLRFLLSSLICCPDSEISDRAKRIENTVGRPEPIFKAGECVQSWFRLTQVQVGLNISAISVRKLIHEKYLEAESRDNDVLVVPVSSVNGLVDWINTQHIKQNLPTCRSLTGFATQNYLLNLNQLKSNKLVICDVDWELGFKGLTFARLKWAAPLNKEGQDFIDLAKFADKLSTYPEAIRHACACGFIAPADIVSRGSRKYLFKPLFVQSFQNKYCFLSELSKKLNGKRRTVLSSILKTKGIRPVSGPEIDGGLIPIYLRADIDKLDFLGLLASSEFKSNSGRKKAGEVLYDESKWTSSKSAKQRLKVNDQEIIALTNIGWLNVSIPPGRERDNFKYFDRQSVDASEVLLNESLELNDLCDDVGISKKEIYLRFVETDLIKPLSIGKRILVSFSDAVSVREDCHRYVSLRSADQISGSPPRHFLNLVQTGRIQVVPISEVPSAKFIKLVPRSMVKLFAVENPQKCIDG